MGEERTLPPEGEQPNTGNTSGGSAPGGTSVSLQGGTQGDVSGGMFWKLLELLGTQGVQFLTALLLARLMTPEEYGTVGLILIFITVANTFVQSGFATALIRAEELKEEDYASVLRLSLLIAVPVYGLLCLGAPAVSAFYGIPVLTPLLRVMGLVLFPGAVISVQTAYVSRGFLFRKLFQANLCAVLLSGACAVGLAVLRFGVWAMAAQQLIYYAALMLALFLVLRWAPSGRFSMARVKVLFAFGWKILVSGLIDTLWMNLYGLIIGKRYSATDLGGYSRAEQFPKMITANLASALQSVLLPAYARCQTDREALRELLRKSIRYSAFAIFPMMAGLAVTAEPLVRMLLTDKWLFCVPYLRILCLCYAFWPMHVSNLQVLTAMGRSDLFLKLEIAKKLLGAAILFFSLRYGITGLLLWKAADEFLCTLINAWPVQRLTGVSILSQYRDMLPAAIAAGIMGGLVFLAGRLLPIGGWTGLLAQIAAGMALYLVLSILLNRRTLKELAELLRNRMAGG